MSSTWLVVTTADGDIYVDLSPSTWIAAGDRRITVHDLGAGDEVTIVLEETSNLARRVEVKELPVLPAASEGRAADGTWLVLQTTDGRDVTVSVSPRESSHAATR